MHQQIKQLYLLPVAEQAATVGPWPAYHSSLHQSKRQKQNNHSGYVIRKNA